MSLYTYELLYQPTGKGTVFWPLETGDASIRILVALYWIFMSKLHRHKFIALGILGVMSISLLGIGVVYAANNNAGATDKKQLGLFSGNGDFIGTVLDSYVGNPSFAENQAINFTVYNSSLNAVVRIYQDRFTDHIYPDLDGASETLLFFTQLNCTGIALVDSLNSAYGGSLQPQILFTDGGLNRYFVVDTLPITSRLSQSSLNENGTCTNNSQTIEQSEVVKEVVLPFSLVWPLTIQPL